MLSCINMSELISLRKDEAIREVTQTCVRELIITVKIQCLTFVCFPDLQFLK